MTIQGTVTAVNGDKAEVEYMRYSACGRACESCGGCESLPSSMTAINARNAAVGDTVEVLPPDKSIAPVALVVYILPIALVFGFSYAAALFFKNTPAAVAGAAAGAALWYGIMIYMNRRVEKSGRYYGRIVAVLNKSV